MQGSNRKLL